MIILRLKSPLINHTSSLDEPAPPIMRAGIGNVFIEQHWLEEDRMLVTSTTPPTVQKKPPYVPLLMADVLGAPLTNYTHISTFSGGGGSCLGFRLAGFRTLLANDIDPHARQCYALNLPSPIDGRDIKQLTAAMLLDATQLRVGELDVFEGSPPCTAFSTAGKMAKGWGQTKEHATYQQTNVEDLFYEWLRLLDGLRPRTFVAENVAGLVRGVAKGYFKDIMRRMKALGYRTEAQILDAQWLGVPQRRGRVIFIGVRDDLALAPRFPAPLRYRYSVRDALPWLVAATYDMQGLYAGRPEFINEPCPTLVGASQPGRNAGHYMVQDGAFPKKWQDAGDPSPAIMAGRVTNVAHDDGAAVPGKKQRRKFTIAEVKRLCSFPEDYRFEGSFALQWARLGNSVPPLMAKAIADNVRAVLEEADQKKRP